MSIFNCIRYPLYKLLYKGYSCIRDGSYDEDPNEASTYDLFMEKNLLQQLLDYIDIINLDKKKESQNYQFDNKNLVIPYINIRNKKV